MNISLVIRALDYGGAERQLINLANGLANEHTVTVITFYAGGKLRGLLSPDVRVQTCAKAGRWDVLRFLVRLRGLICAASPHAVYGFMDVPNILLVLIRPTLPPLRLVWGVRASDMQMKNYDWLNRVAAAIEGLLARFADRIICNSHAGFDVARRRGFPAARMTVIPNGIDTEKFHPRPDERAVLASRIGLAPGYRWIALIGRIDPMKGHSVFLQAAARLLTVHADVRFAILGDGPGDSVAALKTLAADLGISDSLVWLASRDDMPDVLPALDIVTSASVFGEGLSNVLAEAMSAGLDCVATDVGDSARLLDATGRVIPPDDPGAMARAWADLLDARQAAESAVNQSARQRIIDYYGVAAMVRATTAVLAGGAG